jgi:hypothetical protein
MNNYFDKLENVMVKIEKSFSKSAYLYLILSYAGDLIILIFYKILITRDVNGS